MEGQRCAGQLGEGEREHPLARGLGRPAPDNVAYVHLGEFVVGEVGDGEAQPPQLRHEFAPLRGVREMHPDEDLGLASGRVAVVELGDGAW